MALSRGGDPDLLLRVPLSLWNGDDKIKLDLSTPGATVVQESVSPTFRYRAVFSAVQPTGVATAAELRIFDMKRIADGDQTNEAARPRRK